MSRTGYVITNFGFPVLWSSEVKTEIDLSATEAEYTILIQGMCKIITFIKFMKEVSFIFDIHLPNLKIFCKNYKTIKVVLLSQRPNILTKNKK